MALKKSSGFAFIWEDKMLLSHATGAAWRFYSIIKGQQEEGETLFETALREVKEEANITLSPALLAQVENRPPDFVVQNSSKVLTGWYIRISSPEEIGMKTTLDKHEKLHTIIPKEQLQDEEIDWAGFVGFKDAEVKIAPYQMPILEGAKKLTVDSLELTKNQPISKAAQAIIKPEWDKMQEFLNDTEKKFLKDHIIVAGIPKHESKIYNEPKVIDTKEVFNVAYPDGGKLRLMMQTYTSGKPFYFVKHPAMIPERVETSSDNISDIIKYFERSIKIDTSAIKKQNNEAVKTAVQEVIDTDTEFLNKLKALEQQPINSKSKIDTIWFTPEAEKFVPYHQLEFLKELDDEGLQEYFEVFERINRLTAEMPHTYQTDKIPYKDKTIWLHYFYSSGDWWILEKDKGSPKDKEKGVQHQAFGIANLNGGADEMGGGLGEMGYISIEELREIPQVEMDFHFEPTKVSELIAQKEKMGHHIHEGHDKRLTSSAAEPQKSKFDMSQDDIDEEIDLINRIEEELGNKIPEEERYESMNFNVAYNSLAEAIEKDDLNAPQRSGTFEFKLLLELLKAGFSVDVFSAELNYPETVIVEKDNSEFRVEVKKGSYTIVQIKSNDSFVNSDAIILYWRSLEEHHMPQEEDLIIELLIDKLNQLI